MQTISIENKVGHKLAAYLFMPESKPQLFLVVCHGFRGAKENSGRIFDFAKRVNELGMGVLAFDFSGSGASEGDFSTMTLSRQASDLKAVIDYLHIKYDLPVVLLGRSFGGSTAIAAGAEDERVAAFILWSTPVFLEETFTVMILDEFKNLSSEQPIHIQDDAGEFDLESGFIKDFAHHDIDRYLMAMQNRPVLIIHARDDEVVPVKNAVYMQQKLPHAQLSLVEEAGHRFLSKTKLREDITLEWLQKFIRKTQSGGE
ncbi:Alpha/Beta hydrolase fold [Syntrophomonas zehnderi OL-4]|uniref:Alpha/Beta hydrolase fold n=1 Tax=Syntrophomonas zehnderi OL-4 TaxID=690567 RepID=A0A0E4GCF4_9FIRM|nr:alpha/beta fold hydrolase [Syntrophomonas zehnderi]CFX78298.1 Alpha/Beta hydrolase fold [Syntrophomonas zehnderi OL-4]